MDRLLLTLSVLAVAAGCYALMLRGWRRRQQRQSEVATPVAAPAPADGLQVPGLFVGTTRADDWLDRVVVHHLSDRGQGTLRVEPTGVRVTRPGLDDLWVPRADLVAASVEQSLAGKVVSTGMVVLTWRLGDLEVASGFRADDPADHAPILSALALSEVAP